MPFLPHNKACITLKRNDWIPVLSFVVVVVVQGFGPDSVPGNSIIGPVREDLM